MTGRPAQTHCKNGHDLEEWGLQKYRNGKKNGRTCQHTECTNSEASKEIDREYQRKRYWNKKFDEALEEVFGITPLQEVLLHLTRVLPTGVQT